MSRKASSEDIEKCKNLGCRWAQEHCRSAWLLNVAIQLKVRDLSVRETIFLDKILFDDWGSFSFAAAKALETEGLITLFVAPDINYGYEKSYQFKVLVTEYSKTAWRSFLKLHNRVNAGDFDKEFLSVPFREKDSAKALGARWDKSRKLWYVETSSVDPRLFSKWRNRGNIDIIVTDLAETQGSCSS